MNSVEYQSEIRLALGVDPSDVSMYPAPQTLWALNAGLAKIATEREWPWLYTVGIATTVTGTGTIILPSAHSRTVYLTVDGKGLNEASARELADYRADSDTPAMFSFEGNLLRMSPTPNAALPIEHAYFRHEPKLVLDTDAPLIPDAYSDWVVTAAAIKLAIRSNNQDRIAALQAEYDRWLAAAQDNVRRSGATSRLRRTRPNVWPEWA